MTEHGSLSNVPAQAKLRIEDFLLLDASGAFQSYAKTELIEGEIVCLNAQHRPHARIKSRLFVALAQALSARNGSLEAFAEASIEAPPSSAPEPDIVVTDEPDGEGLIPIASVKLVVEVADTTLATDVGRKARFYASQSVPEYWVVDVAGRQIHQMWKPEAAAYAEHRAVAFGEPIEAATVLDLAIETAGLS